MGRRRTTPAATTGLYIGYWELQAEINYVNNAPVVGNWYTVLDVETTDSFLVHSLRFYGQPAATTFTLRATVDGQVITWAHALAAWQWCNGLDGSTMATEPERYALFNGRDILIEIQGIAGVTNLYCRGWYAERVI